MDQTSSTSILTESIPRFCRALRLATLDKRLEKNHTIAYYYDADVVIRMITGFRQFKEDRRPVSDPRLLLVRALLSSGYLGEVQLLRPHALELDESLRSKSRDAGRSVRGDFRLEAESFLAQRGVKPLVLRLLQIIEKAPGSSRVESFLEELKDVGHETFIALELANGDWRERLARFWKDGVILFAEPEAGMRSTLGDPLVTELSHIISGVARRRDGGGVPPANTLRDGAALGMLHRLIRRRENGEKVPFVRFYTETDALKDAWARSPRMVEILSYGGPRGGGESNFIFRDADYFIVRASFEDLSFPLLKRRHKAKSVGRGIPLAKLERVASELEDAISQGDGKLAEYLDKPIGKVPLRSYLEEFESLGFLSSIWVKYEPTTTMESFVSGLRKVWRFASDARVSKLIKEESEEALRQLGEGVRDLREWFRLFEEMQIATAAHFRSKRSRVPDLMKDLGLIRWGIELSEETRDRYEALMAMLVSRDEDKAWRGCADLTDTIREAEADFEQCGLACSILWTLSRFDQIVNVISRFTVVDSRASVGLQLMRSAARLRAGKLNWQSKGRLLKDMDRTVMGIEDEQRVKFLVGLGYLYFHAWEPETLRENLGGGEELRNFEDAMGRWISRSMELGREAVGHLPEFTLEWSYAINHCAYVGTVGGFTVDRYIDKLLQLEKISEIWNYRFADTLAYHYYHSAKRQWEKTGKRSSKSEVDRMLRDIQTAKDVYARAEETFGDPEIPVHLNELTRLEQRILQRTDTVASDTMSGARGIGHPSEPDRL